MRRLKPLRTTLHLAENQYLGGMRPGDLLRFGRSVWEWLRLSPRPGSFPEVLYLETTNACNLRCEMCPRSQGKGRPTGRMKPELYRNIVDQAAGRASLVYVFLDGDPLVDKEIANRVAEARSRNLKAVLHTNAALMDEARATALLDAGLSTIDFSLDTADPERYARMRVGATLPDVLARTRMFLQLAQARPRSKRPTTIVRLIDTGNAEKERTQLADYFGKVQPDDYSVRPQHDWAGQVGADGSHARAKKAPYYPCFQLWKLLAVLWDGRVAACCTDFEGELIVGDASKESLDHIWRGDALAELRQRHRDGAKLPELCEHCTNIHHPVTAGVPFRVARRLLSPRVKGWSSR